MKKLFWSQHAKERFWERILKHGFDYCEIEFSLKKQKVKTKKGFDERHKTEKIECIDKIRDVFLTFQKAEDKETIYVITLWESSQEEVKFWKSRRKK